MPLYRHLLFIVLFITLGHIKAEEQPNETEQLSNVKLKTYVPTLMVSPLVCEVPAYEEFCHLSVSLIWETPKAGHYCLYFVEQDTFLKCWENSWSGIYNFGFSANANGHFFLTRGKNGSIAAKATINILGTIEQQEDAISKQGVWRIF